MKKRLTFLSILLFSILLVGSTGIINSVNADTVNLNLNTVSTTNNNIQKTSSKTSSYVSSSNPYKPFSLQLTRTIATQFHTLVANNPQGIRTTSTDSQVQSNSLTNTGNSAYATTTTSNLKEHPTIYISYGEGLSEFPGDGSQSNPYVIGSFSIIDSNYPLIWIEYTSAYILITGNYLQSLNSENNGITLIDASNVIIENNNVTGGYNGISVVRSNNVQILHNNVFNNLNYGVYLGSSDSNFIENNNIYSNQYVGLGLVDSFYNQINTNTIAYNYQDGIYIRESDGNTISGNGIFGNGNSIGIGTQYSVDSSGPIVKINTYSSYGSGIYLDPSYGNKITGNSIFSNLGPGVTSESSAGSVIQGNKIYSNDGNGIMFINSNDTQVIGNEIQQNGKNPPLAGLLSSISSISPNALTSYGSGIYLDPCNNITLSGNSVYNNFGSGLFISLSSHTSVKGNSFYGNGYQGIMLSDANYNSFNGNNIYQNGATLYYSRSLQSTNTYTSFGSGIYLDPSVGNTLTQNNIHDNLGIGLMLEYSNSTQIDNNTISSNYDHGIFFTNSNYNNITSNDINENGNSAVPSLMGVNTYTSYGSGMYIDPSIGNQISGNNITNNFGTGLFLDRTTNNKISSNQILSNGVNGIEILLSDNNIVDSNMVANNSNNGVFSNSSSFNKYLYNHFDLNGYPQMGSYGLNTYTSYGSGMYIDPGEGNVFTGNNFSRNAEFGLIVQSSNSSQIKDNNFVQNIKFGLGFTSGSFSNLASDNNFINNNNGQIQALDNGTSNTFSYNYYSDASNIDRNHDGIADTPYMIAGTAKNVDATPSNVPLGVQSTQIKVYFEPRTLNSRSRGRGIKTYIKILGGYRALDINRSLVYLNDTINPIRVRITSATSFRLTFSRSDVIKLINQLQLDKNTKSSYYHRHHEHERYYHPYLIALKISGVINKGLLNIEGYGHIWFYPHRSYSPYICAPLGFAAPVFNKKSGNKLHKILKFLKK